MSGVEVIIEDLKTHPRCPHGPTLLFSRRIDGNKRNFFACAACRDRKLCPFFLYEDQLEKATESKLRAWEEERRKFREGVDHTKEFSTLARVRQLPEASRMYCETCNRFDTKGHEGHRVTKGISDYLLGRPTMCLRAIENTKKEAQFMFSEASVKAMVGMFEDLDYKTVICMGTPRIHEYITNECPTMTSLLLDIDRRYHSFYGPSEFCWYNLFNHHFFFDEAKEVCDRFLQRSRGAKAVLVLDPPFGGRVEPVAHTLSTINDQYKALNGGASDLPVFWIFPYFMEPQIVNSLPDFKMLDYKVDYDNHPLFQDGPKGRKQGSPVRIFTNVDRRRVALPEAEGYKFCKICARWVSEENRHCDLCGACTSKDGRTYRHCDRCERCVKPTWGHCETCKRCAQPDHKCQKIEFVQNCFHCKQPGHKKRDCPRVDQSELRRKRKQKLGNGAGKKRKIK